jgi:predicted nuclease of predicted toxin-antitoxin system
VRWLADECVDAGLVTRLRSESHDVTYIAEVHASAADRQVLAMALSENRLLLTEDKDFGDLVFRSRMEVPGVILLRLGPQERHLKWDRLQATIAQFGESLFGRYVVIDEMRMRSRPLLKAVR